MLMCGSADACVMLAKAGFGIAVQPDFPALRDPALAYIPIKDVEPLSYGAYYKSVTGKPMLKLFLQLCKDAFLPGRNCETAVDFVEALCYNSLACQRTCDQKSLKWDKPV